MQWRNTPQVLQFTKVTFGYSEDKILYRDIDFGVDLVRLSSQPLHPIHSGCRANIKPNVVHTVYAIDCCQHPLHGCDGARCRTPASRW